MVEESRIGIYNYVYNLLYGLPKDGKVTQNVYSMNEPQELTTSDTQDGFIVIRVGNMFDESEFPMQTYASVRVFVIAYIPPMSRGRLNKTKYSAMEDAINHVINEEMSNGTNEHYSIQSDGVLSMDDAADTNADNSYYMFVKSFIVTIS